MADPDFGRLRTALLGGQPDRVPLAELKVEDEVKSAFLGQRAADPADREAWVGQAIEFALAAGYDYVRLPVPVSYPQPTHAREHSYGVGGGSRRREWAETHQGLVTTEQEFERFPWPSAGQADYRDLEIAARLLPPGMGLISSVKGGGIFERVWMLMGFESFCLALRDQPALVARMFSRLGELYYQVWQRLAAFPGMGALWLGDDLGYSEALLVAPQLYRQHLFPWYRLLAEVCRRHDLPFIYHSCGRLWEVIPELLAAGINALHPIEPKAMDIREVKARYGRQLCLMGNIDLGYTLTRGTPAEVEAQVRQRIREIAPGGGYCLGSSNSVTEYVPVENFRAMVEAGRRWGGYPISPQV